MTTATIRPGQFYAQANGVRCEGSLACHWCKAPCTNAWRHNEPLPTPFVRSPRSTAMLPHSPFVCLGCFLYLRPSTTVNFISGTYRDRQPPIKHSWLITENACRAIRPTVKEDKLLLLKFLLEPPSRFILMLLTDSSGPNHLHLASVNDPGGIIGGTELNYTLDNKLLTYSPYELQVACVPEDKSKTSEKRDRYRDPGIGGLNGKLPGVSTLLRWIGEDVVQQIDFKIEPEMVGRKKGNTGRITSHDNLSDGPKAVVVMSGTR